MAKLPSLKRIYREDVAEAPSWILQLLIPLNSFMQNVYAALNGGLTLQDNLEAKIIDVRYVGGEILRFPAPFKRDAVAIMVGKAAGIAAGVTPVWQQVDNVIEISNIAGIGAGVAVDLRLVIL